MHDREDQPDHHPELDDDDRTHIIEVFDEEVVPKLKKLEARTGTLSCDFAGEAYENWTILFRSAGSDFEIVEFEYDEEASGLDLDL